MLMFVFTNFIGSCYASFLHFPQNAKIGLEKKPFIFLFSSTKSLSLRLGIKSNAMKK